MSTITERATRFLLAAGLVLAAWLTLVAVVTVVAEPTRRVVVFALAPDAMHVLARSDALIVAGGTGFVIAQGRRPGFIGALYAGGAWLVLPASAGGCRGSGRSTVAASAR